MGLHVQSSVTGNADFSIGSQDAITSARSTTRTRPASSVSGRPSDPLALALLQMSTPQKRQKNSGTFWARRRRWQFHGWQLNCQLRRRESLSLCPAAPVHAWPGKSKDVGNGKSAEKSCQRQHKKTLTCMHRTHSTAKAVHRLCAGAWY